MNKIGLIAGSGRFPILLAQEIRKKGYEIVTVAIENEAEKELSNVVDKLNWVNLGQLQKLINVFKENKVRELVMAGKVTKASMYFGLELDDRFKKCLESMKQKNDESILEKLAEEFEKDGIKVKDPSEFLHNFLPKPGLLTNNTPTSEQIKDIDFSFYVAKKISHLDIGQTVVVKNQVVLAVEAIEGTDKAIVRGAGLGNGNVVVAKVSRPNQDMRFDIPAIGLTTIKILNENKVSSLVIDSSTIILDYEEVIKQAEQNNISIVVKAPIKRLFFSTGEISGDLHASHVVAKITESRKDIVIDGIGGKYMAGEGVNLIENISNLSEMGFFEIIKSLGKYKRLLDKVRQHLEEKRPDKVILVDFAGLNFRIGKIAKSLGIEVVYYIPPKVWAWKSNRIKQMKAICDKVICLFDFEKNIFDSNGFENVYYYGNPLVEFVKPSKNQNQFLSENPEIEKDDEVILLMPGSRNQEIIKHIPEMLKTAEFLYKKNPKLKFVLVKAPNVYIPIDPINVNVPLIVKDSDIYCWLRYSKFAIVASGTATLEAAISNIPMAVVYKVNPLTYMMAKMLIDIKYVSLPNIIAGYQVVPEFIQKDFKAEIIADYINSLLENKEKYNFVKEELDKAVSKIYNTDILAKISNVILEK